MMYIYLTGEFSVISLVQFRVKPGLHYPSSLTARVNGPSWRPVSITRQHGPCWRGTRFPLAELTVRVDGPCWRVMETGHPPTRAVNSGRQLG